jgi:chromosome segregation protein
LRLSQIKLAGFKSFVDPTTIDLPGQIVGVVGPNGCGKSNVIDALRWVLGESRASALRGESMQDVIFNGSARRKPVARASVELIFDNASGKAAGQWASYAEISIKRVLLRNDDSSYYINSQKVRRRDITDIFLGTGLGARAYAIIEQGMISRIIEAKPEELRVFLEEAAGVSKYRERRRETAQRLNDTRDNLLRVDDILQEMDKQLLHLAQQASVAVQYRELETLRDTAQHLYWLLRREEAELARAGFAAQIEKCRTELELKTAVLRENESALEMARSSHYLLSDELQAKQGDLYAANSDVVRLEQQIKHAAAVRLRLQQQIDQTGLQIDQQKQQRQSAQSQLAHWQSQQRTAEAKLTGAEQQFACVDLSQAELQAHEAREAYHRLQREQVKLQQQLSGGEHGNLARNIAQLEAREARLTGEAGSLPLPDLPALQQFERELAELSLLQAEHEARQASLQTQLTASDSQRQQLRSTLQQRQLQAAQTQARVQALQSLQQDNAPDLQNWLGRHGLDALPPLWQGIQIEPGWETALEAVLGERLNALPALSELICQIDTPPSRLALFEPGSDSPLEAGSWPRLLDCVQSSNAQASINEWLASVYTVADVALGVSIRGQLPSGGRFVTPEGHLIDRRSVLFHAPDPHLHGMLSRQREIDMLERSAMIDDEMVAQLKAACSEAEQRYRDLECQLPVLRRAIHASGQRQHALQMQRHTAQQAEEHRRARGEQISVELAEVAKLLLIEHAQQHALLEQMAQLRYEEGCIRAQVSEARQAAEDRQREFREQQERVRQLLLAKQEADFLQRTCADKITDAQAAIELATQALQQSELLMCKHRADLSSGADEISNEALQAALATRETAENTLSELRNRLEAVTMQMQRMDQARLSCEHELTGIRERLAGLALKEQEARLYFEQWAAHLQGVDESALLPQLAKARSGTLQNELVRLSREIADLGAVNLAALDELQAATERRGYLMAQSEDLQQAMATLEDAIRHIDRESRELLMDTYRQVNLHLAELFPVLFAGGEASLVLTGEEILDGGVQVMAQPPGKKNSTIHLMSGGEKALTAIALIFSLFQLNPAPFCLLDEVDAPLDDTNTERLCALVRKMSQHTQFVFISHNKIAMEMAGQLVGVTMQEKGVSKVVSVDIEAAIRLADTDG